MESKLKRKCRIKLESWGWYVLYLIQTNKNGITDTLLLRNGRYIWIEFKRNEKTIPDPLQDYRMAEVQKFGAEVMVVDNYEDIFCLQ